MTDWQESEHPRHPAKTAGGRGGRFRRKGLAGLAGELVRAYPGLKLWISDRDDYSVLDQIVVPQRNRGTGTEVMQALVDEADRQGLTLALSPSEDYGGSYARLRRFYRRFGFTPNAGRSIDYEIGEDMVRRPQAPREGTADWSRLASERLGASGGHVDRVEGRDLLGELTEADFEALAPIAHSPLDVANQPLHGDRALAEIWQRQGFDGLPRVVTSGQMQEATDAGWLSLWRAVGTNEETGDTGPEIAEMFRSGWVRPGMGAYGNGTYFAADRAKDHLVDYYAFTGGGALVHAALSPTARVVYYDHLVEEMAAAGITHEVLYGDHTKWTPREQVLVDAGRFAALRGYDAILYWPSAAYRERDKLDPAEIVILNRTAVIVEAADG